MADKSKIETIRRACEDEAFQAACNGEDLDRAIDAAMRLDGQEHNEMPERDDG
jgi:hypothetical protein